MGNIVINEKQQVAMRRIINSYILLHKDAHAALCNMPNKRYDKLGNEVCGGDCDKCNEEYYHNMRDKLMKEVGINSKEEV